MPVRRLGKASELAYGPPRLAAPLQSTDCIRYSTTQGTNALVQRARPQLGLLVTDPARVEGLAATTAQAQEDLLAALVGDRVGPGQPGRRRRRGAEPRADRAGQRSVRARGQAPGHRGERLGQRGRGGAGEGLYPVICSARSRCCSPGNWSPTPYDIRAPGRACSTCSCTRPVSASCSTPAGGCGTPGPASRRGSSGRG
jgi:hypothetical protein